MQGFIAKRILQGLVTLFVLMTVVFILSRASGDPVDLMVPLEASQEQRDAVRKDLGLDKSYPEQYWIFLKDAAHGDFGDSLRFHQSAMGMVNDRLPNSIKLGAAAMAFALLISIPLGVISAVKRGTWIDHGSRLFAVLGITLPSFFVGLVLIQFFSVRWELLPTAGMGDWKHYIMPAFTLSLFAIASLARLMRSSMIEVLDSDYIKLARVKGVPERAVIWKHALRNSLVSVVTMGGIYFSVMITLAVVVESVFNWPGIGTLAYDAIQNRDFPVIQAIVVVAGVIVIGMNLLVDIAYAYIDPRIRNR